MRNITDDIKNWTICCRDIWREKFANLENGVDEFDDVEEVLFSSLVLSQLGISVRPSLEDCYKLMRVQYNLDVTDQRSVCKTQKAGNIYCVSKLTKIEKGDKYEVKSIDILGTLLDDEAYVEVKLSETEFLLEPIENLEFEIDI